MSDDRDVTLGDPLLATADDTVSLTPARMEYSLPSWRIEERRPDQWNPPVKIPSSGDPIEDLTGAPPGSALGSDLVNGHTESVDDDDDLCEDCERDVTDCECEYVVYLRRSVVFTESAVTYVRRRNDDGEEIDASDIDLDDIDLGSLDWESCDDYDYNDEEIDDVSSRW